MATMLALAGWINAGFWHLEGAGPYGLRLVDAIAVVATAPLVWVTARSIRRKQRFGVSVFELATLPGRIGGDLRGILVGEPKLAGAEQMVATLRCELRKYRSSGGSAGRRSLAAVRSLWTAERAISGPFEVEQERVRVPVRFQVPAGSQATGQRDGDETRWTLRMQAIVRRVRYEVEFEVPVFDLGDGEHARSDQAP